MFEFPRGGLPRAVQVERAPLGQRPGEAWRDAEAGLPVPKADSAVTAMPALCAPEAARRTLSSLRRFTGIRRTRSAGEA